MHLTEIMKKHKQLFESKLASNKEVVETTEKVDEKWSGEHHINPAKKGMWDGWTEAELKSELSKLKKHQETHKEKHGKADAATSTKIREIEFALRSKHGWGKVKESEEQIDEKWGKEVKVNPSEKGKYHNKTIGELEHMRAALMKKEKRTKEESGKVHEIDFAIRAKKKKDKWGKMK